jgi:1-pyrroline-5-carboxylate dehydrogenase
MSTRLNYASTTTDVDTAAAFEAALASARAAEGVLAHLINGQPVAVGEVFDRVNPAHPTETVTQAHSADAAVVADAVAAARVAQLGWRRTSAADRAKALRAAQQELEERKVEIAGVLSAETGKSRLEALGEAEEVGDLIDTYTTQFEEMGDFRKRMKTADPKEENTDLLRPYGVFAVVGPFNFPAALNVNMATGALLLTLSIPRGQVAMLAGRAAADVAVALFGDVLGRVVAGIHAVWVPESVAERRTHELLGVAHAQGSLRCDLRRECRERGGLGETVRVGAAQHLHHERLEGGERRV